jgi:hypothetical protein
VGGGEKQTGKKKKKSEVVHMCLAVAIQSLTTAPLAWSPHDAKVLSVGHQFYISATSCTIHTSFGYHYGSKVYLLLLQVQFS